jgi:hypothetical protein
MVRARQAFQQMRKSMDNRLGLKADGSDQNVTERSFRAEDLVSIQEISQASRDQEAQIEKKLKKMLKRFPVYRHFLEQVKGVGPIAAATIISEFDIQKATTVSKLWQYAGMNPGMVRGKKRVDNKDGTFELRLTDKLIRGDKLTSGFVAPFNKQLRVALCGILADGFIKAQAPYALNYYYPYKERLAQSEKETQEITKKGADPKQLQWKEAKPGHRDRAAKRYMIKMFLKDLYVAWRTIEGLPVRPSYQEEYLGHKHAS